MFNILKNWIIQFKLSMKVKKIKPLFMFIECYQARTGHVLGHYCNFSVRINSPLSIVMINRLVNLNVVVLLKETILNYLN